MQDREPVITSEAMAGAELQETKTSPQTPSRTEMVEPSVVFEVESSLEHHSGPADVALEIGGNEGRPTSSSGQLEGTPEESADAQKAWVAAAWMGLHGEPAPTGGDSSNSLNDLAETRRKALVAESSNMLAGGGWSRKPGALTSILFFAAFSSAKRA